LHVTVLERGDRLLRREVDATCSDLVADHFARAGIEIMRRSEATHVVGTPAVSHVVLKDNHTLGCDVFLAATGIRSNVDLARQAGVSVRRGVLVDERMQTRVSGVFCRGRCRRTGRTGARAVADRDGTGPSCRRQRVGR
jgi:nitrite reductase (NADH) large subunit